MKFPTTTIPPKIWIDLSHWETERGDTKAHVPFNWQAFWGAGGSNATIRSTYMSTPLLSRHGMKNDVQYWANIADAKSALIDPMSYHLYEMKPGTWQEQADFYLGNTDFCGMPAMGDFELNGLASITEVRSWLEYVESKTNQTPWFYTSSGWMASHFKTSDTWLRHYPLLLANYNNMRYPAVPLPWFPSDPIGIQFSGKVYAPAYGVQNGNKEAALYEVYIP